MMRVMLEHVLRDIFSCRKSEDIMALAAMESANIGAIKDRGARVTATDSSKPANTTAKKKPSHHLYRC